MIIMHYQGETSYVDAERRRCIQLIAHPPKNLNIRCLLRFLVPQTTLSYCSLFQCSVPLLRIPLVCYAG
jgi:hypothetical protein